MEGAFEAFFRDNLSPADPLEQGDFWGERHDDFLNEVKFNLFEIESLQAHELLTLGGIFDRGQPYNIFSQAVSAASRRSGNERFFWFLRDAFIRYAQRVGTLNLGLLGVGDIWNSEGGVWDLAIHYLQGMGWYAYLDNGDARPVWQEQLNAGGFFIRNVRFDRRPGSVSVGSM